MIEIRLQETTNGFACNHVNVTGLEATVVGRTPMEAIADYALKAGLVGPKGRDPVLVRAWQEGRLTPQTTPTRGTYG